MKPRRKSSRAARRRDRSEQLPFNGGALSAIYEALYLNRPPPTLPSKAPAWLSDETKKRATAIILAALQRHPGAASDELIWHLAAELTAPAPHRLGRRSLWQGERGVELVELLHIKMLALGLRPDKGKGLRHAIAAVRQEAPRYQHWSEERLRRAYYEAAPRALEAFWQAVSDAPDNISVCIRLAELWKASQIEARAAIESSPSTLTPIWLLQMAKRASS